MDIYNRLNPPYNDYVICASKGKADVAVGGNTVHSAFEHSRNRSNDGGLRDGEPNTFTTVLKTGFA
ncbi:hypothetical protein HPB48_000236 [Haemaphysalis longicornis]|uniref:Uncharacterized protein n=1 Tax=Haemaphysalis longicornis TaxID=44386 RepID=A0A9J6GQ37_HAELO|nr:hypothetical protein HPB48_000236 [Haemaphysalis longicornis]